MLEKEFLMGDGEGDSGPNSEVATQDEGGEESQFIVIDGVEKEIAWFDPFDMGHPS